MTEKKKIAIIGLKGLPPFGGAANVGDNIIQQLAEEYDFTVYATETHTSVRGEYKGAQQIVFRKFPIKKLNVFYHYIASAFHAVFRGNYDMVHLHHMDGAFILLLLRWRYKVVATSHGLPYLHGKWSKLLYPYFKANEWMQARLSNHLTVVSRSLVGHYARVVSQKKITHIPNGITVVPVTHPAPDVKDYILFAAGRIIPLKGLHILLAALHKCGYKGKVIVLGDYTQVEVYRKELFSLAEGLDIEFRGLIKDKQVLNSYIVNAKLFIFPSTHEAMSMMLLEVASLKVPVICSDIVQNTDVFNPDEMLFFRSDDASDLAGKISWAMQHPDEMKVFATRAYEALVEKYQWTGISRLYDALFKRVIVE
ncbi:MAG: glycosyltransferase family 4 protein [Chitinophagaceae bacterium]|nr:glycosyltransferase family 4 protein [Chitinophagaceae bacterium]